MLTEEQKQCFQRDGYLLVPGVLSPEQVNLLRDFFRRKFLSPDGPKYLGDGKGLLFDVFNRYPEVRWLLFHPPTLAVLRDLLGPDFVVLREAAAHYQQFGTWHKDTTSQENAGHRFQWDGDYLFVEVAYYLQDNSPEFGGGLDVERGSHRMPDRFRVPRSRFGRGVKKIQSLFGRVVKKIQKTFIRPTTRAYSIPNKAGDLVIFDFRINHRATPQPSSPLREDREKIAVFLACGRNVPRHVQGYHDFISSRPDYVYLKDFAYAADLLQQAAAANVTLA
jgi:Phytanoyl-CoA dioxygenase (PhyH)